MASQAKDSKAKALATASTLQRVVCPTTERDPLELLSSGYRKVDEQKRYTNRLTNLPDKGVGVVSRDGSFSEPLPGPSKGPPRTQGRAVLDQMFGHLRPHHNIAEPALLQMEQHELENALGDQAARAAFYRPSITAALMAIPSDNRLLAADGGSGAAGGSASTSASMSGALYRVSNSPMRRGRGGGDDSNQSEDGDSEPEIPGPEEERPSTASSQRAGSGGYGLTAGAGVAASGNSITSAGRFSSPRAARPPMGVAAGVPASPGLLTRGPEASNSPMRTSMNGIAPIPPAAGGPRAGSARRTGGGALPTVSRSYPDGTAASGSITMSPQLGCAGATQPPPGAVLETPRLPAAATQAGAKRGNRRASVSGAEVAAAAAAAAAAAGLPAIGSGGASPSPGGRARRASLVGGGAGYGASAAVAMNGLPTAHPMGPSVSGSQRFSMPGNNSIGLSGGSFTGGANGMPLLSQRGGGGGGGAGPGGGAAGAEGAAPAVASRLGMRSSLPLELPLHGSPHSITSPAGQGPQRSGHSVSVAGSMGGTGAVPRVRLSYSGVGLPGGAAYGAAADAGAEGSPWPGAASTGLLAQLQGALHSEGSGPSPPAVNPSVPLSGLEALSATGLGDAISQLRNIRISAAGAPPVPVKEKPKKVEPGLAGVTPLSLLPVPLPPIENWQSAGKAIAELDPCKDIRLVDAPRCILPRPTEEQDLQSKMAAHKNAMRELVKAEGAPMSEGEMEAVKLLGRLERSGARMRNYGDVEGGGEQESPGPGQGGSGNKVTVMGAA